MATPPTPIVQVPTPRQTIPYADRPLVDLRSGRAIMDHYQFLERLSRFADGTIQNVTTIIVQTNDNTAAIVVLEGDVVAIEAEIAAIQAEIDNIQHAQTPPPPAPAPRPFPLEIPPAPTLRAPLAAFPPAPARVPFPTPMYGATADRPVSPPLWTSYGDDDLGLPIWWNGTDWVDGTGTPV